MINDSIDIKLEEFEGPLDLLLHLIKKNEIDIYDIPIAQITEEYMNYINEMKKMKLEIASDYIVMAATLIKIKTDYLLPKTGTDEEVDDPRKPLVDRLLEYQKIKKATELFRNIELEARKLFGRSITMEIKDTIEEEELSIVDLMNVFTPILKKGLSLSSYRVPKVRKTISDKISELMTIINEKNKINFNDYILGLDSVFEIILSFISILEMVHKDLIRIRQDKQFDVIWVEKF